MGREIGFNLYIKDLSRPGQLTSAEVEENTGDWVCGRTEVTSAWGEYFSYSQDSEGRIHWVVPVFQKELEEYIRVNPSGTTCYKYVDFARFKENIDIVIEELTQSTVVYKHSLYEGIQELYKDIERLRKLQQNCNEKQSYAFDRWNEEIAGMKEEIMQRKNELASFDDEDYDSQKAKQVEQLLERLEKYLAEDKYFVIPYYSF